MRIKYGRDVAPTDEMREGRPVLIIRFGVVFVVAVTFWWLVLYRGVDLVAGSEPAFGKHVVRAVGATLVTVPLIYAARRFLDRRPWAGLGLSSVGRGWRPFLFGAACWAIPAALSTAVVLWLGWADLTLKTSLLEALPTLLLLIALVLLYEALPEELIFRGYFLADLTERWSTGIAVLAQATLFIAFATLIGATGSTDRFILLFSFASVLGALRVTTRNLWAAIGFHATYQVTTQFLHGNSWNDRTELHDPDLAVGALSFVVVPFLGTAVVLWLVARKRIRPS